MFFFCLLYILSPKTAWKLDVISWTKGTGRSSAKPVISIEIYTKTTIYFYTRRLIGRPINLRKGICNNLL